MCGGGERREGERPLFLRHPCFCDFGLFVFFFSSFIFFFFPRFLDTGWEEAGGGKEKN